jgi:anti-sigma factor RsiW
MERNEVHELTAAYALDALDEIDEQEYELHLRGCERCRRELTELSEAAASLAYAFDAPTPPTDLRERILDRAREERPNVVPLRPRRTATYLAGAVAAAAAAVAVGIGIWAASLSSDLDRERAVSELLSEPGTRVVALSGATGRVVVSDEGEATVVLSGLDEAPSGRAYAIWVIERETPPRPAGLFRSEGERDVVDVERPVPRGAIVAMTIEDEDGADQPTRNPFATAQT